MFFESIFPKGPTAEDSFIELYSIPHDQGPGARKLLLTVDEFHDGGLDRAIQYANKAQHHLYYRNSLRYPKGGWKGTWCLWADIDLDDPSKASSTVEAIQKFRPEPTWMFWSGRRGYHLVWLLSEFQTDPKKVQARLRGLVEHLGADPAVGHTMKGLRVPGSYNWKAEGAGQGDQGLVRLIGPNRLVEALNSRD